MDSLKTNVNATMIPIPVAAPEKMLSGVRWLDTLTIGLLIGTTLTIIKRFYVRSRLSRTVTGSDWIMLLTQLLLTTVCALSLTTTHYLKSYMLMSSPTYTTTQTTILLKVLTICYSLAACTARLSISASLPKTSSTWTKPIINTSLVLLIIFTLVFLSMTLFPCGATLAVSLTATCDATRLSAIFNLVWSILNSSVGILILAAAVFDVAQAKEARRVKALGFVVATIGAAAVAASAARVVLLLNPVDADPTLQKVSHAAAAVLEIALAVIAGSMALFRPVVARWIGDGTVVDPMIEARHGRVMMVESRPTTSRSRPVTRGRDRKEKERPTVTTKRVEELEWAERMDVKSKRNGVVVTAQELEIGLTPPESPVIGRSIWKS
ncbi:hypothetical protein CAC42_3726 [Sphaceloma murrayae]|uniref:Rhodopsin domain-containing protein n=1 Tax=Sphaceloma murrayae TaxID=2082308 RepID=A0A2K1QHR2_9PEZI|nr:hypothetical protein CAC42_3726 [Sphaceloma murrayae]